MEKMMRTGKIIKSDGQVYTFNPGKNGSLMSDRKYAPPNLAFPKKSIHKVVPLNIRRKRDSLSPAIVGSNRG